MTDEVQPERRKLQQRGIYHRKVGDATGFATAIQRSVSDERRSQQTLYKKETTNGVERGPRYAALIRSMAKWSDNNPGADAVRLGRMMLDEVHALETELADTKKDYVGMCAVVRERDAQIIAMREDTAMLDRISAMDCQLCIYQDGSTDIDSPGLYPITTGKTLRDAIRALGKNEWKPTHVHSDGGTYRFLHLCRIKMVDGIWHDGVVYETKDGERFATHLTRWEQRFEVIE